MPTDTKQPTQFPRYLGVQISQRHYEELQRRAVAEGLRVSHIVRRVLSAALDETTSRKN